MKSLVTKKFPDISHWLLQPPGEVRAVAWLCPAQQAAGSLGRKQDSKDRQSRLCNRMLFPDRPCFQSAVGALCGVTRAHSRAMCMVSSPGGPHGSSWGARLTVTCNPAAQGSWDAVSLWGQGRYWGLDPGLHACQASAELLSELLSSLFSFCLLSFVFSFPYFLSLFLSLSSSLSPSFFQQGPTLCCPRSLQIEIHLSRPLK